MTIHNHAPPSVLKNLQPGDILIKLNDGSPTNRLIKTANTFFHPMQRSGGSVEATHAAIYLKDGKIAESSGEGIHLSTLSDKYRYIVYRFQPTHLDDSAQKLNHYISEIATQLVSYKQKELLSGNYNFLGLLKTTGKNGRTPHEEPYSTVTNDDKHFSPNRNFFCSEFVVAVVRSALAHLELPQTIMNRKPGHVSPQELHGLLYGSSYWKQHITIGDTKKVPCEAGYLPKWWQCISQHTFYRRSKALQKLDQSINDFSDAAKKNCPSKHDKLETVLKTLIHYLDKKPNGRRKEKLLLLRDKVFYFLEKYQLANDTANEEGQDASLTKQSSSISLSLGFSPA